MADELKDQRVVTMMTPSELEAVDDWMFRNRIRSRGEAIRRLCQIGMRTDASMDMVWRSVRSVADTDLLAILELARPGLSDEERGSILALVENDRTRANMIIGTLALRKAVDAFRSGADFEDAKQIALKAEAELAEELRLIWAEPR